MNKAISSLQAAARRLGLEVTRVEPGCLVVQRRGNSRKLVRVGGEGLGLDLLLDRRAARSDVAALQRRMAEFLAGEQVAWVLRATDANLVLDVGANVGQYARSLRRAGYRGRIASFEPVSEPFQRLSARAAKDPLWEVYPWGLGATDGTAEINAVPGAMSSLLPASEFGKGWSDRLKQQRSETIQVRRLDTVIDQVTAGLEPLRAYLKMDTQGFDLEVFAGAKSVLDRVVGMQSEVACVPIYDGMPRLPEQLSAYEAEGFETVGMFPVNQHRDTLRVIEFDLVMVRAEAVARKRTA